MDKPRRCTRKLDPGQNPVRCPALRAHNQEQTPKHRGKTFPGAALISAVTQTHRLLQHHRTNEAARAGRPEGPAASPRGQRRLPRHRGGDNIAILDRAPDALHPRRNAHNCGAASAGASDMNKIYMYSHPNAHSQPAQSASLARMRDSRLSTPLELSDVLALSRENWVPVV